MKMEKEYSYMAVDAHSNFSQVAVLASNGELSFCKNYPTSAPELIEAVNSVKGHKKMVVEESQIADWIKRTLYPYVDELIIADPKKNAWIAKAQHMNDKIAAIRLARLLKGGYISSVYHSDSQRQQFKELIIHYHDITTQITRFKNKLKSEFIAKAIPVKGDSVYSKIYFPNYLEKLNAFPISKFQVENYFATILTFKKLQAQILKKIRPFYKLYPEIRQLSKIPGIGQIRAFTISAFIDTPHRFSNKRKLWSYCCLSKTEKTSNGKIYCSHSGTQGNKLLKYIFLQAAMDAIRSKENSVFKKTAERLSENNVSKKNIRRSVARQIASVVLTIWKTGEAYSSSI